jgi:hypothetical protein
VLDYVAINIKVLVKEMTLLKFARDLVAMTARKRGNH